MEFDQTNDVFRPTLREQELLMGRDLYQETFPDGLPAGKAVDYLEAAERARTSAANRDFSCLPAGSGRNEQLDLQQRDLRIIRGMITVFGKYLEANKPVAEGAERFLRDLEEGTASD